MPGSRQSAPGTDFAVRGVPGAVVGSLVVGDDPGEADQAFPATRGRLQADELEPERFASSRLVLPMPECGIHRYRWGPTLVGEVADHRLPDPDGRMIVRFDPDSSDRQVLQRAVAGVVRRAPRRRVWVVVGGPITNLDGRAARRRGAVVHTALKFLQLLWAAHDDSLWALLEVFDDGAEHTLLVPMAKRNPDPLAAREDGGRAGLGGQRAADEQVVWDIRRGEKARLVGQPVLSPSGGYHHRRGLLDGLKQDFVSAGGLDVLHSVHGIIRQ